METGGDAKVTNKKRLGLNIPVALYKKINDRAQYQGKTINSTCLDIFWEYFEQKESIKRMESSIADR